MEDFDLYDFQIEVVAKLLPKKRFGCFLDLGLGKTFVALALMELWNIDTQLVIVCPKNKLRQIKENDGSWENMIRKYFDSNFSLPNKYNQNIINESSIVLINFEMFHKFYYHREAYFIIDEIQYMKNYKGKAGMAGFYKTMHAKKLLTLSGSPIPNGIRDGFNLMRMLDPEKRDMTYKQYQNRYFQYNPYAPFPQIIGYKNVEEFHDFFQNHGVWLKSEDVIDLPEQIFIPVYHKVSNAFQMMKKDKGLALTSTDIAISNSPIQLLMFLRELSSGLIKFNDEWYDFSTEKTGLVRDIISSTENKIIIYYNFTGEWEVLVDTFRLDFVIFSINGQLNEKELFIQHKGQAILLAQYQSASVAIDGLQNVSNYIICYSPPISADLWGQMLKRIHRIGQSKTCYYYLLQNSLETKIYQALKEYKDFSNVMFTNWLERG